MSNLKVFGYKLSNLACYFTIYSFIGWCIETIYVSSQAGRLINRGFLLGPFCPIYGFAALILLLLLRPVKHNIFLFFIGAVLLTTVLEYVTGFLLEEAFNRTWWDYSKQPFNLNGRICLRNSLIWGSVSVIIIYFLHPFIRFGMLHIPLKYKPILSYIFIFYFFVDTTIVTASITGFDPNTTHLQKISSQIFSGFEYIKGMIPR